MLPSHCATYICTTHSVRNTLYQAQVSNGHDHRMQALFDGNSVPDQLVRKESTLYL